MSPARTPVCLNECNSYKHGDLISSAIIRGNDDEAIAFIRNLCCKYVKVRDSVGRTALQVASSCGRNKIILWLLSKGADINEKDHESGYTALHRAILYGNLSSAILLQKLGANLSITDKDGLTPLDLVTREQPVRSVSLRESDLLELYVWGANTNYNLGQSNLQSRDVPEPVELFHHATDSIQSISLNKFHTIFLSKTGRAFACGFGLGGRLGLGNESSIIIPQQINTLKGCVKMVSAGVDHSIFLTDSNQVFTCGTNLYYQLGLSPPPDKVLKPTPVTLPKLPKGMSIEGVGAAKYHSVVWTKTLVFTFGLNAGQLGHINNLKERMILNPRQVSGLQLKEGQTIKFVASSDGAIVVCTSNHGIQVLHQYQVRYIASKMNDIIKIGCTGGNLDHEAVGNGKLTEKGGLSLRVAAIDSNGYLYIWTEETHRLSQCLMVPHKRIVINDFCINSYGLCFITKDYEAFTGVLLSPDKLKRPYKSHFTGYADSVFQNIKIKKLPGIHRAVFINCDPKGDNFAAFQYRPKLYMKLKPYMQPSTLQQDYQNLLAKSSEFDPVCDVILNVRERTFPAHSYILSQHSSYFAKTLASSRKLQDGQKEKKLEVLLDVDVKIFQEALNFLYSGTCQLVQLGPCMFSRLNKSELNSNENTITNKLENSKQELTFTKSNKTSKGKRRAGKPDSSKDILIGADPVKILQDVARSWEIRNLEKKLDNLQLSDGLIIQKSFRKSQKTKDSNLQLSRRSFSDLWDVAFICLDGATINAHKCVLVARSVYFEAMLMSGWIETNQSNGINMPLPSKVFKIVIDFLYDDDSTELRDTKDVEFLCDVLAVAHQLLIVRLQQFCEQCIVKFVTFKNAFELISFADCFDASGLRSSVFEFISLNFSTFFEMGALAELDSKTQEELSGFYKYVVFDTPLNIDIARTVEPIVTDPQRPRSFDGDKREISQNKVAPYYPSCPSMVTRCIVPMLPNPSPEELCQALEGDPSIVNETEADWIVASSKLSTNKQTKTTPSSSRKRRPSRTSEGGRSRKSSTSSQVSQSSASEMDTTLEFDDKCEPFSFDDLKERERGDGMWVVVGKSPREEESHPKEAAVLEDSVEDPPNIKPPDLSKETSNVKRSSKISIISIEDKKEEPIINHNSGGGNQQQADGFFPSLAETTNSAPFVKKSGRMPKFQSKSRKSSDGKSKESPTSPILSWRIPKESSTSTFADIMQKETESCNSFEQVGESPSNVNSCVSSTSPSGRKGWGLAVENSASGFPVENSLLNNSSSPSEPTSKFCLSDIMKEQIKDTKIMNRKMSKPLSMIQIEDRAMQELLAFYGGSFNPEEKITVSRAT